MSLVDAFRAAVVACDPTSRVAAFAPSATVGIAIGKAAVAMARGATVQRGIIISPVDGHVPGWRTIVSAHPYPDERSIEAAREVRALIDSATADDVVLALISGGASALIEDPIIPLADFVEKISGLMSAGVPIDELNRARTSLSNVKGGKLVAKCRARVVTLVASDVIGDRVDIIGSGPTVGRAGDEAHVILPMRAFADALHDVLGLRVIDEPYRTIDADALLANGPCIAWGEPTLQVTGDGEGGRAQQLALELARRIRGTDWEAFVAGTDGIDGPPPRDRPAPAGALVDGGTWEAIIAAGFDPERALARCDAGTALAAAGALVVTGPTGVNHADVAILRRKPS